MLEVIRTAGYYHVIKLSAAISLGLIAIGLVASSAAVVNHIADSIEVSEELDIDFLYLPLLLAGTYISNKVKLNGENPRHTLELMKKAYESRLDLFAEADMAETNKVFNQFLRNGLQQAS